MADIAVKQSLPRRLGSYILGKPRDRQERLSGLSMTLPAFIFFVIFIRLPPPGADSARVSTHTTSTQPGARLDCPRSPNGPPCAATHSRLSLLLKSC